MKDAAAFEGTWRLVSATQSGEDVTTLCDSEVVYRLDGQRLLVGSSGGSVEGECFLDPTTDPKRIDMTYEWDGTELVTRGVYQIEDDRLAECFGGTQRPDSFDGTIPDGRIVYVYRRVASSETEGEA